MDSADLRTVGKVVRVTGEDLLGECVDDVLDDKVRANSVDKIFLVDTNVIASVECSSTDDLNNLKPYSCIFRRVSIKVLNIFEHIFNLLS